MHDFRVACGAAADGHAIGDLDELPEDAWISFVVLDRGLVLVRADAQLHAGDQVLVLADQDCAQQLRNLFEA